MPSWSCPAACRRAGQDTGRAGQGRAGADGRGGYRKEYRKGYNTVSLQANAARATRWFCDGRFCWTCLDAACRTIPPEKKKEKEREREKERCRAEGRPNGGAGRVTVRGKEEVVGAFDLSRRRRQSVRPLSYNGEPSHGCVSESGDRALG